MGQSIKHLYRRVDESREYCFNIALSEQLSEEELDCLRLILADGFLIETVSEQASLTGEAVVEVGPRLNFATAWSSNLVSICQATGLHKVVRVERSRRFLVPDGADIEDFVDGAHDRMTECQYLEPLTTFETGVIPEAVYEVDLKSTGPNGLLDIPGISMDEFDRNLYYDYFVNQQGRNPTIVEIMDLNNANSEHSRHGFFKGCQVIDGIEKESTLLDMVGDLALAELGHALEQVAQRDEVAVGRAFVEQGVDVLVGEARVVAADPLAEDDGVIPAARPREPVDQRLDGVGADRHKAALLPRIVGAHLAAGNTFDAKVAARMARQDYPDKAGAWLASAKVQEADGQGSQ